MVVVNFAGLLAVHGHWRHPRHALAPPVALKVALRTLEGVEGNLPGEAGVPSVPRVSTLVAGIEVLEEQVVDLHFLDVQQRPTTPEVEVLLLVFVRLPLLALPPVLLVHRQGLPGYHLNGSVHAPVAVVEVHWLLRVSRIPPVADYLPEAAGEEHGVRVKLHGPGVPPGAFILDDLGPEPDENVRVQRRVPSAPELHCQVACHDVRRQRPAALRQCDALVAVDGILVAIEDAHALPVLVLQHARLVALRHH
mmetsp:Transcript_28643/g.91292  ORF Transcript_28643/g.91292 Transcript_28643/m.91292 type:complete len:251 (-) Transcript_28643:722-1474(-)